MNSIFEPGDIIYPILDSFGIVLKIEYNDLYEERERRNRLIVWRSDGLILNLSECWHKPYEKNTNKEKKFRYAQLIN